eukprot:COSAG01_NODE_1457_length_10252_cov_32.071400_3_plen_253_part_00
MVPNGCLNEARCPPCTSHGASIRQRLKSCCGEDNGVLAPRLPVPSRAFSCSPRGLRRAFPFGPRAGRPLSGSRRSCQALRAQSRQSHATEPGRAKFGGARHGQTGRGRSCFWEGWARGDGGGGACGWQQRGGAVKWVKWAACARVERPAAVGVDVIEHVVDLPQVVLGAATQPQQHRQAEVVLGEGDPVVHLVQHRALQVLEVVGRQLLIELSTQRRARNGLGAATQSTRGKDPIAAARPARSPAAGRSAPA